MPDAPPQKNLDQEEAKIALPSTKEDPTELDEKAEKEALDELDAAIGG